MKPLSTSTGLLIFVALMAATAALSANAQTVVQSAPSNGGAKTIYRQTMPDGSVVYSDKAQKGGKIDRVIPVFAGEPPPVAAAPAASASERRILARTGQPAPGAEQSVGSSGAAGSSATAAPPR